MKLPNCYWLDISSRWKISLFSRRGRLEYGSWPKCRCFLIAIIMCNVALEKVTSFVSLYEVLYSIWKVYNYRNPECRPVLGADRGRIKTGSRPSEFGYTPQNVTLKYIRGVYLNPTFCFSGLLLKCVRFFFCNYLILLIPLLVRKKIWYWLHHFRAN